MKYVADHFDQRSKERAGHLINKDDLKHRICNGNFSTIAVDGSKLHYAVPIGNDIYRVIYNKELDTLVTMWCMSRNCVSNANKHKKHGKHKQTTPKKLVPLRSFGRMTYEKV